MEQELRNTKRRVSKIKVFMLSNLRQSCTVMLATLQKQNKTKKLEIPS
jgi:hypothetical protein